MKDLLEFISEYTDVPPMDNSITGGGRLIDADTAQTGSGDRIRFPGINAREVTSFDPKTGLFKSGEYGGDLQKAITQNIIDEQGFNIPVYDKNKKDATGTRFIGDYENAQGQKLSNYLIANNLTDLTPYATREQIDTRGFGTVERFLRNEKAPINRLQKAIDGEYKYENEGDMLADVLTEYNSRIPVIAKATAPTAKIAGALPDYFNAPAVQRKGEDEQGYVTGIGGQLKAGLKQSYESTARDFYGAYNMRMTGMGNKEEAEWSAIQIDRLSSELESLPMLREMEAFDPRSGEYKLDSATKMAYHVVGALSSSATGMGVTIGSRVLAAAASTNPYTIAAAPALLAVPVAMNAGRVWNNQPEGEKNEQMAWLAGAGISVLDMLGIEAIVSKSIIGQFGKKAFNDFTIKELMKKGASKAEAEAALVNALGSLGKQFKIIGTNALVGAVGEGITEGAQDLVEHWGSNPGDMGSTELLKNKIKNSAFSGAIVGGVLTLPGSLNEVSEFKDKLREELGQETAPRENKSLLIENFKKKYGTLSDTGLALWVRTNIMPNHQAASGQPVTLNSMSTDDDRNTLGQQVINVATDWRKLIESARNFVRPYMQHDWGQMIGALFDSPLARGITSGLSPYKRARQLATSFEFKFTNLFEGIRDINKAGKQILEAYRSNPNSLSPELTAIAIELDALGKNLAAEIGKLGGNNAHIEALVAQDDFFLKNRLPLPSEVKKNAALFQSLLEQEALMSPEEASALTQQLTYEVTPHSLTRLMESGVTTNEKFDAFLDNNILSNASRMIDRLSMNAVKNTIFGKDGEVVAALVAEGVKRGDITAEEGRKLAAQLSVQLDAFDGKLNVPKSPLVKGITENMNFISTMIYMDTALAANLGEMAYGMVGLQTKDMGKYVGRFATQFAKNVVEILTTAGNRMTAGLIPEVKNKSLNELRETGHLGLSSDILLTEGVSLNSRTKRNLAKLMFKLNLVEGATNMARVVRGSFAIDEMNSLITLLMESNNKDAARWARDRLEYYRVDVDRWMQIKKINPDMDESLMSQDDLKFIAEQQMNFKINFIDEFASRPEPGSSPLIFDDHRFALFTQFKRFVSHFTANVLPQLWSMYIKRGNPKYNYATFSAIMTSTALAYAGLSLKAALRGDDEDEEDKVNIVKALEYSWLGSYADLYDMGETAYKVGTGKQSASKALLSQAPGVNTAVGISTDAFKALSDEEATSNKAKDKLVEKIPFAGEFPALRDYYKKD